MNELCRDVCFSLIIRHSRHVFERSRVTTEVLKDVDLSAEVIRGMCFAVFGFEYVKVGSSTRRKVVVDVQTTSNVVANNVPIAAATQQELD